MKTFLKLWIAIFALLFASACDDEETDLMRPEIEVASPAEDAEFAVGTAIPFQATFSDDQGMSGFSIEVHDNFDGHDHKRTKNLVRWDWSGNFEATGATFNANMGSEIAIPENAAAGPYHFIVSAIDASGNATTFQDGSSVEVEVYVTNATQPAISINMEPGEDELEGEPGEAITLTGTITDPTGNESGIEELIITLGEEHDHDHDHKSTLDEEDEIVVEMEFETPVMEINLADHAEALAALVVPADAEEGDHKLLTIVAKDVQGNLTVKKIEVHVHDH